MKKEKLKLCIKYCSINSGLAVNSPPSFSDSSQGKGSWLKNLLKNLVEQDKETRRGETVGQNQYSQSPWTHKFRDFFFVLLLFLLLFDFLFFIFLLHSGYFFFFYFILHTLPFFADGNFFFFHSTQL